MFTDLYIAKLRPQRKGLALSFHTFGPQVPIFWYLPGPAVADAILVNSRERLTQNGKRSPIPLNYSSLFNLKILSACPTSSIIEGCYNLLLILCSSTRASNRLVNLPFYNLEKIMHHGHLGDRDLSLMILLARRMVLPRIALIFMAHPLS